MFDDINIMVLLFASLVLWVILLLVETLKRTGIVQGEYARKSIHIYSGFFLALLPVFANRHEIILFNFMFLISVIVLSGYLHYFRSIEDVHRWTWGQFLYPVGLILVSIVFADPAIYSFAVLELALADGFAAVFGMKYGRFHYSILGSKKTLLGSLVFFLISATILAMFVSGYGAGDNLSYIFVISGALGLTLLEGSIGAGFDNLVIPIATAVILSTL